MAATLHLVQKQYNNSRCSYIYMHKGPSPRRLQEDAHFVAVIGRKGGDSAADPSSFPFPVGHDSLYRDIFTHFQAVSLGPLWPLRKPDSMPIICYII